MLLVQQDDFLINRESQPRARDHVCFYSPEKKEREERSYHAPVDLLTGWRKMGSFNRLAGWVEAYIALIRAG